MMLSVVDVGRIQVGVVAEQDRGMVAISIPLWIPTRRFNRRERGLRLGKPQGLWMARGGDGA